MNSKRILYLDILRILACMLVVLVHVSAQHIYDFPAGSVDFNIHAASNSLAFSGVAIYIMISGALMLNRNRDITVKTAVSKAVHFYLLYFLWKFIYCIVDVVDKGKLIGSETIREIIIETLSGRGYYHLWFLPTIATLYLFAPMIKKSVENDKSVCKIYLTIFFFVAVLLQTVLSFEFRYKYMLEDFFKYNTFYLFTGYLGYYILGHYINSFGGEIKKPVRIVIYLLGIISLPLSGLADSYISNTNGEITLAMNTPFSFPSLCMTTAIFLLVNRLAGNVSLNEEGRLFAGITKLAAITFGIYLLHPVIILVIANLGMFELTSISSILLPITTIAVTVVTAIPVLILINIPFIKKTVT